MREGVKKNDEGLFEVFFNREMVARVKDESVAWTAYNRAHIEALGQIHSLRAPEEIGGEK